LFLFLSVLDNWIIALFSHDSRLHRARFASFYELSHLLDTIPVANALLLGTRKGREVVCVRPTKIRREIGNLLIVAPTRGGKGLLAASQLLSWQHSVIVNDIKGELFAQTAGYRSRLGKVFVIDPGGVGHCFDPLHGKQGEDEFYSSASHLLFEADEKERIFTQRAIVMLTQLFLASRREGIAPFPYTRFLIRLGLESAASRLNLVDPDLATQFLDRNFLQANWSDKFLLSSWSTLTTRMRPLLTETVVRSLTHSDFTPQELLCSEKPLSVYIRWKEQDLLALSPLVRLLWGTLMNELTTTYDKAQGEGCKPVLLLIDEAGRSAIPSLADQATTVVGRGVSMWIAIQSLSQLETVYGKARSQVLRDNMESQIYYRPTDLATARYLEERLGSRSAYAHSITSKEGAEVQEGQSERPIPLLSSQEIAQFKDEEIIGFHRHLPPMRLSRLDWRKHPTLIQRQSIPAPQLQTLPPLADMPMGSTQDLTQELIDPDMIHA